MLKEQSFSVVEVQMVHQIRMLYLQNVKWNFHGIQKKIAVEYTQKEKEMNLNISLQNQLNAKEDSNAGNNE